MKKSLLAVVVVGIAMMIPSLAFASSTCGGYSQKTCTTNTTTSPAPGNHAAPAPSTGAASNNADTDTASPTEATTATTSSTLPFTGLDVGALMVGASLLLGAGLVMRYLSRDSRDQRS